MSGIWNGTPLLPLFSTWRLVAKLDSKPIGLVDLIPFNNFPKCLKYIVSRDIPTSMHDMYLSRHLLNIIFHVTVKPPDIAPPPLNTVSPRKPCHNYFPLFSVNCKTPNNFPPNTVSFCYLNLFEEHFKMTCMDQ